MTKGGHQRLTADLNNMILVEGNELLKRNHAIAIAVDAPDHLFALVERYICPPSLPAGRTGCKTLLQLRPSASD